MKITTHKLITTLVHLACLSSAIYILIVWREGVMLGGYSSTAPDMLRYIAWVEITNLSQYAAKSGYDHHLGIFDGVSQIAMQSMESNDLANGPAQVEQAVKQINDSYSSEEVSGKGESDEHT